MKAWRLLRHPRLVKHEMALRADYDNFKRRYRFLSGGAEAADPEKRVLVVSMSDWVAQVKAEAMLAKALQLRGYTPVIVTTRACRRAIKYFRLFGYEQFVFFDEWLRQTPEAPARTEAQRVLDGSVSLQSLFNLQYRQVHVGRHALSSVMRTRFDSHV